MVYSEADPQTGVVYLEPGQQPPPGAAVKTNTSAPDDAVPTPSAPPVETGVQTENETVTSGTQTE